MTPLHFYVYLMQQTLKAAELEAKRWRP